MTLRILMFGRTGQVATEVQLLANSDVEIIALCRDQVDLSNFTQYSEFISKAAVDVVLNAAAYTDVDAAEIDAGVVHAVNAEAPGEMAGLCAARDLPFIHISTDYVFNGEKKEPWVEDDPTGPVNAYGRSKLAGERAVRNAGGRHVILRTSWVFSAHRQNFVKTMLRIGEKDQPIEVVGDQYGAPTAASDIASTVISIAKAFNTEAEIIGTFHYCGAPAVSWHGFAEKIFSQTDWLPSRVVKEISTSDLLALAARPKSSILDCTKILDTYGIAQPDWRKSLAFVLDELKRQNLH